MNLARNLYGGTAENQAQKQAVQELVEFAGTQGRSVEALMGELSITSADVEKSVQGLVQRFRDIAETARDQADTVQSLLSCVLKGGDDLLHEISTIDMSRENLKAQERIKKMTERLVGENTMIAGLQKKTADASEEIERTVSGAIMDMQFQDRVMQHIQNVNAALAVLSRAGGILSMKALAEFETLSSPERHSLALLIEMAEQFTLSDMRDRFIAAMQLEGQWAPTHRLSEGDVDLF